MTRFVVRPAADRDLEDAEEYLAGEASPETAQRFLEAARSTFTQLATMPLMGKLWEKAREEPLSARRPVNATDFLRRIVGHLDAAGVPSIRAGSFASTFHGTPRATQNIDLAIARSPRPA